MIQFGYNHSDVEHPFAYDNMHDGFRMQLPQLLMCGVCDKPVVIHINHEEIDSTTGDREFCDRGLDTEFTPSENLNDYYLHSTTGLVPYVDYTGSAASIELKFSHSESEFEFVDYERELDAIDNWRDKNPDEQTYATSWTYRTRDGYVASGTYDSPKCNGVFPQSFSESNRNVFVEGQSGFYSEQVFDPELTAKYALRLLNVFTDKSGNFRCGGIKLTHNADSTITASCVQDSCLAKPYTVDPAFMTTAQMEEFVLTVIRHGNNHAARWFTSRNTFYKIHMAGCTDTANCPTDLHYCPSANLNVSGQVADDDELLEFVLDHAKNCKVSECKHNEVLASLDNGLVAVA